LLCIEGLCCAVGRREIAGVFSADSKRLIEQLEEVGEKFGLEFFVSGNANHFFLPEVAAFAALGFLAADAFVAASFAFGFVSRFAGTGLAFAFTAFASKILSRSQLFQVLV
jgi:hypothetical protein